jgi:hypothetical protein
LAECVNILVLKPAAFHVAQLGIHRWKEHSENGNLRTIAHTTDMVRHEYVNTYQFALSGRLVTMNYQRTHKQSKITKVTATENCARGCHIGEENF